MNLCVPCRCALRVGVKTWNTNTVQYNKGVPRRAGKRLLFVLLKPPEPCILGSRLQKATITQWISMFNGLEQGLQTFSSKGYISHYTTVRGPDILQKVIVSRYLKFHQIKKFFVNILFFHYWQNVSAGRILQTLV